MMKYMVFNRWFFALGMFLWSAALMAQKSNQEKIHAMKIGMITENLQLSSEQAEKFWPVYHAYESERVTVIRQMRKLQKQISHGEIPQNEIVQAEERIMRLKEQESEIVKSYRPKFLKVISQDQYASLLKTERQFHDILMQRIKTRG